ncbi:hypothetical protein [Nonomuraea soli]|uniref:YtkA-like domain-containing protein n=1 Tax=Nonomuraea soli TaxID=1032476 RepID=A0A7W0CT58_9ACTN|nr:hypothetical protein [Nonomuraea soli]MBA2896881.1 hypothetical protein [Nonomuraea soli]
MKRLLGVLALVAVAVAVFVLGRGDDPVSVAVTGASYAVRVEIGGEVEVRVTSGRADTVTIAASMPSMGHAAPEVSARLAGAGRFVAGGEMLSMAGLWQLSIRLTGPAGEETLTVQAPVSAAR